MKIRMKESNENSNSNNSESDSDNSRGFTDDSEQAAYKDESEGLVGDIGCEGEREPPSKVPPT